MTRNEMQHIFLGNISMQILWMQANYPDHWILGGELWRTPQQAAWNAERGIGSGNSLHLDRLALDIPMVHKTRKELVKDDETYKAAGEHWKSLHPLNRWGGDIPGDGNHFSMSPDGRI